MNDAIEALPKCRRFDPEFGKNLIDNEIVKHFNNLEIGNAKHAQCPAFEYLSAGVWLAR